MCHLCDFFNVMTINGIQCPSFRVIIEDYLPMSNHG